MSKIKDAEAEVAQSHAAGARVTGERAKVTDELARLRALADGPDSGEHPISEADRLEARRQIPPLETRDVDLACQAARAQERILAAERQVKALKEAAAWERTKPIIAERQRVLKTAREGPERALDALIREAADEGLEIGPLVELRWFELLQKDDADLYTLRTRHYAAAGLL